MTGSYKGKPLQEWTAQDYLDAEIDNLQKAETGGFNEDGLNFYGSVEGSRVGQMAFDVFRQKHPHLDEKKALLLFTKEQDALHLDSLIEPRISEARLQKLKEGSGCSLFGFRMRK